MRIQRIERLQRIIAIQGVSLVRILNHPSLDRLVGRDSKYPLTQSVGRENLSGCHLAPRGLRPLGARWHPSRFSLPLSFVCGYSRISPFLTLSFGEDLWILTRSPPSITLISPGARCERNLRAIIEELGTNIGVHTCSQVIIYIIRVTYIISSSIYIPTPNCHED